MQISASSRPSPPQARPRAFSTRYGSRSVVPAKAGTQYAAAGRHGTEYWVPALKGVYARLRGLCAGTTLGVAGLALAALAQPANAADAGDFFKGRNVSVVIGYSVGGGYDSYGRLLARYLGEHIPGRPTVVPQNMPGAGSVKAANYIYSVAAKDGTVIGTFGRTVPVAPLLAASGAAFDATKFTWLGSVSKDTSLCVTSRNSTVRTWDDFLKVRSTLGGEGAGSDPDVFALLYKNIFGAKVKLVSGYPGTNDTSLAMERGEIDGFCGLSWSTLRSRHPDWLQNKSINIIVQAGLRKEPELSEVPFALDLAKTDEQRQILKLILVSQEMARPFAAPPGLPADRKAILLAAFDATLHDGNFLAEAKRESLDVDPVSARELDALLAEVYATSKGVAEKAAKATTAE
jgi:tripartite-type tricarboxylate transporter receptor subunit TctC